MDLVNAIDAALAYVQSHPDVMTRIELDEFSSLANAVYDLAFRDNLLNLLPQVAEMRSQLESDERGLPPVQFETELNLPGDWEMAIEQTDNTLPLTYLPLPGEYDPTTVAVSRIFMVSASPRWLSAMARLRRNAVDLVGLSTEPELDEEEEDCKPWNRRGVDIQPQTRKILVFMENKLEADTQDLFEEVWGEHSADVKPGMLSAALNKANRFLLEQGFPKSLSKVPKETIVRWA